MDHDVTVTTHTMSALNFKPKHFLAITLNSVLSLLQNFGVNFGSVVCQPCMEYAQCPPQPLFIVTHFLLLKKALNLLTKHDPYVQYKNIITVAV